MSQDRHEFEEDLLTEQEKKEELKEPPLYKVLLHNDDFTTMDFVLYVLQTIFNRTFEEALHMTYQVHFEGVTIGGVYPFEIAEMKMTKVIELAQENDFPFMCTIEEE